MGTPLLVLVGPHGAGKTTLGQRVGALCGVPFEDEIGRRLREEALRADPGAHALRPDAAFDRAVLREERLRDARRRGPAVVESWHPGNLGYVRLRSPALLPDALEEARRAAEAFEVTVQPLRITRATALRRLSEPGPGADALVAFFAAVAAEAEEAARALGFTLLPPLACDDAAPDALARLVAARWPRPARARLPA